MTRQSLDQSTPAGGPTTVRSTFRTLHPFGGDLLGEACGDQLQTEQLKKRWHQNIAIDLSNALRGHIEFVCEREKRS